MRPGLAAFLAIAAASSAAAQSDVTGVNYTDGMRSAYQGPQALPRLHYLARCIVERARSASERMLETAPDSHEEDRVILGSIRARLDQCAQTGIAVSDVLLRGVIAEALYKSAFANPAQPNVPARTVEPIQWSPDQTEAASLAPVYELGRCIVADHALLVHQLLQADPNSRDESLRFSELRPLFAPCLVQGTTLETNRGTLRGILAEALYNWSRAQAPGPSAASTSAPTPQ